jgi:hypothetical protein
LGLAYMLFGLVRATVLGLMERPEPAATGEEQLADPNDAGDAVPLTATTIERRAGWTDRRQKPEG